MQLHGETRVHLMQLHGEKQVHLMQLHGEKHVHLMQLAVSMVPWHCTSFGRDTPACVVERSSPKY
jgi:bisphosphoglycerate-independent phosphoglycerate mutase (AlkP superfamily)